MSVELYVLYGIIILYIKFFEDIVMRKRISFIGVGNMATAILKGITSRIDDPVLWSEIILYDTHRDKIEKYADCGATLADSLKEAVLGADCIILCVKPQSFPEILPELSKFEGIDKKLFVSIAAGIATGKISVATNDAPVVRVMPNTPMLIGQGVSAVCRNKFVSDSDYDFVCKIFSSAGQVIRINEDEMNRIISVTGSSPAYVFMMIKAMYQGAVEQGLLRDSSLSRGLTEKELIDSICDTIIGAAMLMKSGDKTPDEQIKTVCSKGGTTERAVAELERYDFYNAISDAMKKCTARADELGSLN